MQFSAGPVQMANTVSDPPCKTAFINESHQAHSSFLITNLLISTQIIQPDLTFERRSMTVTIQVVHSALLYSTKPSGQATPTKHMAQN